MGRLRVSAIMLNGTCIAGYADTGTQPSCVNRLVPAALGRDDETVSGFIGFAVGRTDFWEPLVGWRAKRSMLETAVNEIARRYRLFVDVFEKARAQ